jgi:hypothetical protein
LYFKNELTPKSDLLIFSVSDPRPPARTTTAVQSGGPKGGITENQQVKKSPLGDLGVRQTFQSGFKYKNFNLNKCE